LAREVVALCAERPIPELRFAYADDDSLWDKVCAVARKIYGAAEVTADKRVRAEIERLQGEGYGRFPVCIAKTQYSFSTDPTLRGAPSGHSVNVREIRLAAGAGFIVVICGDVMTMPGLPRAPAAARIDIDAHGEVVGLS
jgi:formate--tetrahydrofolate ligase